MVNTPDNWIVLQVNANRKNEEPLYKILCGWSGGYLDGDCWKMNSGISKIVETNEAYEVHGFSGSLYVCYKDSETIRNNCYHIFEQLTKKYPENVKKIDMKDLKEIEKEMFS